MVGVAGGAAAAARAEGRAEVQRGVRKEEQVHAANVHGAGRRGPATLYFAS